MKLSEIKLWVSPLTNIIYLGTVSKREPNVANQKRDATDEVLSIVAQYLDETKTEVEFHEGILKFEPKVASTP